LEQSECILSPREPPNNPRLDAEISMQVKDGETEKGLRSLHECRQTANKWMWRSGELS
jgi:hypothetical protein